VLAGCSSSDSGADAAGLTGDPIKLGSVLTITNPTWDNTGTKEVNEAFANYINKELGGIDGRPVEVESCDDHGDPAKTTQCFNNLKDSGVVAFVNNSSLAFGSNALPLMEKAGLANLGGWPITPPEYSSADNFPTTPGASGSYPALAVYFRSQGAQTLSMLYSNTPGGQTAADAMKTLWTKLGGTGFVGVEYDPTAPDFTPPVSKAAKSDPDATIFATGEGTAARLFQAGKVAGLDGMWGATSTAATKNVFSAAGDSVDGIHFSFAALPADFESEDSATYRDVMSEFSSKTELNNQTGVAASSMMFAYDVLSSVKGDVTAESVLAAARATPTWEGFLTHAVDKTSAPADLPSVGNPWNTVATYEGGKFSFDKVTPDAELADYVDEDGGVTWFSGTPRTK
jgi:branched-chain amino acid transport system substrate-binding protein